ncbi:MAG: 5-(carboxyamino)imidazole ribonucleotide synthase [Bacteroidota bacterium]
MKKNYKIGILGGGQLGKMLTLAAQNWDVETWILDVSKDFPAGNSCTHFVEGSFKNYDDVIAFGKDKDVITVEIESVNVEALLQLQKEGKKIHPSPQALMTIKDKGIQKQFYQKHNLPTSPFILLDGKEAILENLRSGKIKYPFVQKARTGGYDGRGVAVIKSESDNHIIMPVPSVIEPLVDIHKELSVIAARNEQGVIKCFPVVEMEFNPVANLVEYLLCPAVVSQEIADRCEKIAIDTIEAYDVCGLLAVEMFLTNDNEVLINEVAPRPHNSGHHSIDANITSQYQQHLRAIMNLPLGNTDVKIPSVMVNLLGAEGHTGDAIYENMDQCMAVDGAKFHLYGKKITKPFRKMGHVTILNKDIEVAKMNAKYIRETLKIRS